MYAAAEQASLVSGSGSVGTRFLVYPQPPFVPGYERPELVWIPIEPGRIRAGPQSSRIYIRDPLGNKAPYSAPYLPPFAGLCHPPAEPGPDGHFDHLVPGSRSFRAAHAFASAHRILDICENYMGEFRPWFFEPALSRLEVVPYLEWGNAQSGFGFLELGAEYDGAGFPFALNFDVIAHEMGHLVLFNAIGVPALDRQAADYFAYHEAIADFISLIGLLHFDTAVDRILRRTRGNLLIINELDRFAEVSDETQVRRFSNSLRMRDVGADVHDRSKPFAGALFDSLIEIYQAILFERGLSSLNPRTFSQLRTELSEQELDEQTRLAGRLYDTRHFATKAALTDARDIVGNALFHSWSYLSSDTFSLADAARAIVSAAELTQPSGYEDLVRDCFSWRGFI